MATEATGACLATPKAKSDVACISTASAPSRAHLSLCPVVEEALGRQESEHRRDGLATIQAPRCLMRCRTESQPSRQFCDRRGLYAGVELSHKRCSPGLRRRRRVS